MRRAIAWGLAAGAALLAALALVPGGWPGLDIAAAMLPAAPLLAAGAIALAKAWPVRIVAAGALVVAAISIAQEAAGGTTAATAGGRAMIVVTHNVGAENVDPAGTIAALAASDADVLLLQETDGRVAPYLARLHARFPYSNPCLKRCSLAIFSRWPMARVRWRFRDAAGGEYGPGLLQSRIRLPWGGETAIASLHLSHTDGAAARARTRAALADAVARAGTRTLVIGGDFNLTPWGSAMRGLDAAMRPLRRATRAIFSFPAFWHGHAVPLPLVPIDHLYAGPAWSVAAVRRLPKTGSDHYPIRVVLVPRLA